MKLASVLPFPRAEGAPRALDPAELVHALLDGDIEAQGMLWDRYAGTVRAVLRRSLGPGSDVEDSVQEVFIQFFRSLKSLREPAALSGFLVGISIRIARGELRRRRIRRWFSLTPDGEIPDPPDASTDTGREQARRAIVRLYAILDSLDDESRLLFVLRHIERLDLADVSTATKLSLATVKRKLARVTPIVLARARADGELSRFVLDTPDGKDTLTEEVQL